MVYVKKLFIQILFFMVIVACLASLGGCSRDPQGLRQTYDSNAVVIKIINHDEALRQINMPVNHANGGN